MTYPSYERLVAAVYQLAEQPHDHLLYNYLAQLEDAPVMRLLFDTCAERMHRWTPEQAVRALIYMGMEIALHANQPVDTLVERPM